MNDKKNSSPLEILKRNVRRGIEKIFMMAERCKSLNEFKSELNTYLLTDEIKNKIVAKHINELINNDGKVIYELSTGENIKIDTINIFWKFVHNNENISNDLLIDLYHQFCSLYQENNPHMPTANIIDKWMKRWPSGLDEDVINIRKSNKDRIIKVLVNRIENRHSVHNRYIFEEGLTTVQKIEKVNEWWNDIRFQLTMAVKSASELNKMLNYTLDRKTLEIYHTARQKEIPIFVTPYYLSLLNTTEKGYNDQAIRSYVIYSKSLVNTFGKIHAWEKEDIVSEGEPNAAGWLLPDGHNVHRRYPDVAILIPETVGRACGGLCASCQRMYDFQSKHFNFDFENLKPKESWHDKLIRLMDYFEKDKQIRDILITGGDALMSHNHTIKNILDAVYKMALRKKNSNLTKPDGQKYAEIQRVRLGTRLLVYMPMRIDEELIAILKEFKEKASKIGIRQFIIQTHFQTPLEITPESEKAIKMIQTSGWTITNQNVYNVAASRRGHSAKLRKCLNEVGIICYYTFTVKGFDENHEVFTPNSRSIQEKDEEKRIGYISKEKITELENALESDADKSSVIHRFCMENNMPFIATDRNVLNLPGIGKSMTFKTVGITEDGKRILQFDHDRTRKHSPIIDKMGKVYIKENKSLLQYLQQLNSMHEDIREYESIWNYTEGETEKRFPLFNYPDFGFTITDEYSNLKV